MNEFVPQCKGVDASKVKILDTEMFYTSIKYDGVYIQIQKSGNSVSFYTSSGKEFSCIYAANFAKFDFDFKIETEYVCDGGKLGTRAKADNEIKKAVKDSSFKLTGMFILHDILQSKSCFIERMIDYSNFKGLFDFFDIAFQYEITFKEAKENLPVVSAEGWEGLFLKRASHMQLSGKKSNDAIKLKNKLTADLKVTEVKKGYCTLNDEDGLIVNNLPVGIMSEYIKVGDVIEIEYEQIINTYVQPVFKAIRHDKMA